MPATPSPPRAHRPDTAAAHQAAVEKVIRHMKANLVEWDADLSLNALAREGCYSKSHLIEVFESITGTTPHHFLASLRIQKAKELLLNTRKSVTEISLEVGYQSFPTFSRVFLDYVGVQPSTFRTMPPSLAYSDLAAAASSFIARGNSTVAGAWVEGSVSMPSAASGLVFVGTFTRGVPQGRPESGTVLLQPGHFRIPRPRQAKFHLLAVLTSWPEHGQAPAHSVHPTLVASQCIQQYDGHPIQLALRPVSQADPPLVVSLPNLLA